MHTVTIYTHYAHDWGNHPGDESGQGLTNVLTTHLSLMSNLSTNTIRRQLKQYNSNLYGVTAKMLVLPVFLHFAAFQHPDLTTSFFSTHSILVLGALNVPITLAAFRLVKLKISLMLFSK